MSTAGAALCDLTYDGRPLIVGVPDARPFYHGALLVPWPNRVAHGRYPWRGHEYALPINEPELGHAIHGFGADLEWVMQQQAMDSITLTCALAPAPGYPFRIDLEARYRLHAGGLDVELIARNVGLGAAPYGAGSHPYLVAGDHPIDEWVLRLAADTVLGAEPVTKLPGDGVTVVDGPFDFRAGDVIGPRQFSRAFTGFAGDPAARSVELSDPSGTGVALDLGPTMRWVQVYTGDVADPDLYRRGVAVEPMTCAPNAFNTGLGLVTLEPSAVHISAWRIRALGEHRRHVRSRPTSPNS